MGRFIGVEEIGSIIIDPVKRLRVSDIANVSFRCRGATVYRVDRQPSVGFPSPRFDRQHRAHQP